MTTHKFTVFVDIVGLNSNEGSMRGELERDVLSFSNQVKQCQLKEKKIK